MIRVCKNQKFAFKIYLLVIMFHP